ncbi:MAG TPA: PEGA domain-containing protein [Trueperaceae bacterium]
MKRLLVVLFALVSMAFAQNVVISPQSIVVNPRPSFDVDVFLDKGSSGGGVPVYNIGENIRIGVRVSEAAYIYLFNVRSTGEVVQILPNRFDQSGRNNYLQAGQTVYFPPQGARYNFEVDGPSGLDKVIAVASKDQLDVSQLAQFQSEGDFARSNLGEKSFAQTLSIIVTPLPQAAWVTDTALFYVGQQPPAPQFGTIDINSNPSGATVYVDEQFVGYTPVTYGTTSGTHTIRVERSGYSPFQTQVNVPGGNTVQVNASLSPVVRNGTVYFQSQPSGAQVYVDGNFVGTTPTGQITLAQGNYQARFSLPGYFDATANFSVGANSSQTVSVDLQGQNGSLFIQANVGGAQVYVDGRSVGAVPSPSGQLTIQDLAPGTHELTVVAPGFQSAVRQFQIQAGQTTQIRVTQARLR